jgi:arylsulfatase A-like enzyme
MNRREFLLGSGAAALLPAATKPPNIVFVLTDDQGYGDVACLGNPYIKTPNMDRLHGESVCFTDFHASPTCSPTRASLMTGRHEFKSGVTHTINERERLSLKATTIAQVLKSAGYTTGIFGKWHLGDAAPYQPNRRGFDEVYIHGCGGIGQAYPGTCGDVPGNMYQNPTLMHNGVFEKTDGYCTDMFFRQALKWIDEKRKGTAPLFAYIPTNAPHAPLQCPEKYERMYADADIPDSAKKFFGMITNIDDNLGILMAKLKEWDMERNTVLIFMTDNGGTGGVRVFNAGMRGSKNTPYQGGTRVPTFWRWTGHFQPGDVDKLTMHRDFFPTFAELAGARIPAGLQLDGRSLLPLLRKHDAAWPERYVFQHIGRWEKGKAAESKYAGCSVRTSRFNMVNSDRQGRKNWELYDIKADPGEQKNIAGDNAEAMRPIEAAYDKWWQEIQPGLVNEDAIPPAVNPYKELYQKQFGPKA